MTFTKAEKVTEKYLKEMFKRVGEKFPNPELTDQEDWYSLREWTEEEEKSYGAWLKKQIKKDFSYMTSRMIDLEVGMFLLNWGWRIKK